MLPYNSTFTVSGTDPMQLSQKISETYNTIADYLTANKLKVSDDKTHLIDMTTRQKRQHVDTSTMSIIKPSSTVQPSSGEKLLGAFVHQDMRWKAHILCNKESLAKSLNMRKGAIKKIRKCATFKYISKLIYLMPIWAGCEDYLVKALQVTQNKVARSVTKKDKFTTTKVLMKECG